MINGTTRFSKTIGHHSSHLSNSLQMSKKEFLKRSSSYKMQDMPGFIEELPEEEQLQSKKKTSKELEEEEAEKATAQAFKTLALILK